MPGDRRYRYERQAIAAAKQLYMEHEKTSRTALLRACAAIALGDSIFSEAQLRNRPGVGAAARERMVKAAGNARAHDKPPPQHRFASYAPALLVAMLNATELNGAGSPLRGHSLWSLHCFFFFSLYVYIHTHDICIFGTEHRHLSMKKEFIILGFI